MLVRVEIYTFFLFISDKVSVPQLLFVKAFYKLEPSPSSITSNAPDLFKRGLVFKPHHVHFGALSEMVENDHKGTSVSVCTSDSKTDPPHIT